MISIHCSRPAEATSCCRCRKCMATIGLAFVLEGVGDLMWGANVKVLDVGLPSGPSDWIIDRTGMFVEKLEIAAAVVAVILVTALTLFSQYTKMGRALRAVADEVG
ncbi:MAG: hypothetical protein HC772_19705, partial [Leptolyngbyaceae cyanobacterium CRU_2_3]|nr:hypothetical protein [Leptolyngbyaceae cyanobacterium CRU_2_3]